MPTVESAIKLGWSTNINVFSPSSPYSACITGMPTNEVLLNPAHIISAPMTEYFQLRIFPKNAKKAMAKTMPIQDTETGYITELLSSILEM